VDGFGQGVVPHHVSDLQVLECDDVMLPDELGAELVVEVFPLVGDLGVLDGEMLPRLPCVGRTLRLGGELSLEALQSPLPVPEELRVRDAQPLARGHQRLQAEVYSDG